MSEHAILKDHQVVLTDFLTWAKWYEAHDRTVAKTSLGITEISTVFLGLNHQFGIGPPLWFETMVFGGQLDQEMDRYTTWEEAERGHLEMVARVEQAELNKEVAS